MLAFSLLAALTSLSLVLAHPVHHARREVTIVGRSQTAKRAIEPEYQLLVDGNKAFKDKTIAQSPTLLKTLSDDGQAPPFMFLGCSDSRVSEGTIFDAKPGTLFTERNIANQFQSSDSNTHAVLAYAVAVLGVKHVIVMGHYGCGGVAAAIATPPRNEIDIANGVVQGWIQPVREIFQTSSRPEIVELRERIKGEAVVEEPDISEPGFRALVEENVKANVHRIATDSVISSHYALLSSNTTSSTPSETPEKRAEGGAPGDVYIHGWVYDIENGEIRDLNISVGPPGKAIPSAPFEAVVNAAEGTASGHSGSTSATPASTSASESASASVSASVTSAAEGAATATASATPAPIDNTEASTAAGNSAPLQERCEKACKAKRFFMGRSSA